MAQLDIVSLTILFGAVLALAGIMSSLIALRFGAPLLLVFLVIGMLAGESGPLGIKFDDVKAAYTVGSVALALILFDGGLRTRFQTFRNVIGPAGTLATAGVIVTAALTAPAAVYTLGLSWTEGLLMGAAVASTDAAAVFFLLHARGLRLRPRVSATLEVESGTNDPVRHLPHHHPGGDSAARPEALAGAHRPPGMGDGYGRGRRLCSAAVPRSGCSIASICRKVCMRHSWRSRRWWYSRSPSR